MSQIDKLNDYDRTAVTAVMYNIIFMNEIAISSMFDTMDLIERSRITGTRRSTGSGLSGTR